MYLNKWTSRVTLSKKSHATVGLSFVFLQVAVSYTCITLNPYSLWWALINNEIFIHEKEVSL